MRYFAAFSGLAAVAVFAASLAVFSSLNPGFHALDDFVSKLGASGQPYAVWWNLIGFGGVGVLLAGFGWGYGQVLGDRLAGLLLALFGLGFSATGIPVDLLDESSAFSKMHVVAICLGLAAWLFALARLAHRRAFGRSSHRLANIAAALVVLGMIGFGLGLWSMPVAHRLVFAVVFGWSAVSAVHLLLGRDERSQHEWPH